MIWFASGLASSQTPPTCPYPKTGSICRHPWEIQGCTKIIEYAFDILKVSAIFVGHNPNNIASAYLIKKLGFTYLEDSYYPPTGLYHPSYIFEKK